MKKRYGVIGNGKLGSLLRGRADFVSMDCDITSLEAVMDMKQAVGDIDVLVNCAAISSVDKCEMDYQKAIDVNVHGTTNLHNAFGSRVLTISSDHLFSGKSWYTPHEDTKPSPISAYGFSKLGAEVVSGRFGGKVIRLSRTVSLQDVDIKDYLETLGSRFEINVPTFFHRNYIHRDFAVDGIEYMAKNWDSIKFGTVHYSSRDTFSMYLFMVALSEKLGFDSSLVKARNNYFFDAPRPKRGGLKVGLASKLGFPMYSVADTINRLEGDAHG